MKEIEMQIDRGAVMEEVRLNCEYMELMSGRDDGLISGSGGGMKSGDGGGRRKSPDGGDARLMGIFWRESLATLLKRLQRYIAEVDDRGGYVTIKMQLPDRSGEEMSIMVEMALHSYMAAAIAARWQEMTGMAEAEAGKIYAGHCLDDCEKRLCYRRAPRRGD